MRVQKVLVDGRMPRKRRGLPEVTVDTACSAREVFEQRFQKPKVETLLPMNADVRELAKEYLRLRMRKDEIDLEQEAVKAKLCRAVGDGTGFIGDDGLRVVWLPVAAKVSWKDVAIEAGASRRLVQKYTGEPGRKLDVRIVQCRTARANRAEMRKAVA